MLLDENLMEISHTSPLYLRDHSKLILRTALWNDSECREPRGPMRAEGVRAGAELP